MQTYSAYYEKGRIVPIGNPRIPEGRRIIITVLDEPAESAAPRQPRAFSALRLTTKGMRFDREAANER